MREKTVTSLRQAEPQSVSRLFVRFATSGDSPPIGRTNSVPFHDAKEKHRKYDETDIEGELTSDVRENII